MTCSGRCPLPTIPARPTCTRAGSAAGWGTFRAVEFKEPAEAPDEEYPLTLTTGRIMFHYHTGSMTRRSEKLDQEVPEGYVEISPEDADRLGLGKSAAGAGGQPPGRDRNPGLDHAPGAARHRSLSPSTLPRRRPTCSPTRPWTRWPRSRSTRWPRCGSRVPERQPVRSGKSFSSDQRRRCEYFAQRPQTAGLSAAKH